MRMRTLVGRCLGIVATATVMNGMAASDAEACTCLQPTVESSYNFATDVIIAEVRRDFDVGNTRYYVARAARTYKGCIEPGDWVLLSTPTDSGACGSSLTARRHLINGTSAGTRFGLPVLAINLCSYDVPVSALTEHDRAFLNGRTVCCGDECTCADGSQPVQCFVDPCDVAPACDDGQCVANYCGGCNAEFYDASGYAVCSGDSECVEDQDCPDGEWCRQTERSGSSEVPVYECVPFVGEGASCNGFTTPWDFEQCAEGLTCDTPDFTVDAPGICRRSCETDADCGDDGSYCAADKLCDADGACEREVDCNLPGNSYPHIECVGHGVCGETRQCGWECGNPQCVDVSGFDFGPCDAFLGWGVQDNACAAISGCGSEWMFFATEAECQSECS